MIAAFRSLAVALARLFALLEHILDARARRADDRQVFKAEAYKKLRRATIARRAGHHDSDQPDGMSHDKYRRDD